MGFTVQYTSAAKAGVTGCCSPVKHGPYFRGSVRRQPAVVHATKYSYCRHFAPPSPPVHFRPNRSSPGFQPPHYMYM